MIRDKNAEECDLPAGRQAQRKPNSSTNADNIKNIFGLNSIQTIFCYSNLSPPLGAGFYFTAIILISTFTNLGNADTCTVSLAGNVLFASKYFPYTSFTSEKRFMSVIKIVVLTT